MDTRPGGGACCQWWARALEPGTDAERYGPLIEWADAETAAAHKRYGGSHYAVGWIVSAELGNVRYCPWCGKRAPDGPAVEP